MQPTATKNAHNAADRDITHMRIYKIRFLTYTMRIGFSCKNAAERRLCVLPSTRGEQNSQHNAFPNNSSTKAYKLPSRRAKR